MARMITHSTVFQAMESFAPLKLAYDWDNVGLQVGSVNGETKKVMITLDVLESVVDEAIEKDVNLIIAHHPFIFKPLKQIDLSTPTGRVLQKIIQHEITVYIAHTNLDIAPGGVNDMLCEKLNINNKQNLINVQTEKLYKLAVYTPTTHVETIRNALSEAGAGHIGHYSHCTFQTKGQGTFKPLEGAHPYIGLQDELTFVDEVKLETIVKDEDLSSVLSVMTKAHPYEKVAYDVFPLINKGKTYGLGRIGLLSKQMNLKKLSTSVKETFDCSHVRVIGDLKKNVQKVAVLGGSGEKYIHQAKQMGADVYITGDMTFHTAQEAEEIGLAVIDAGHYIEKVMKQATKEMLEKTFAETDLKIITSKVNTDPFQSI